MCTGGAARLTRFVLKIVQLILALFTIICLFLLGPNILWIAMLFTVSAPIFGLCCMWQCHDTKGKEHTEASKAWLKADYILCFLLFILYLIFAFIVLYHFARFYKLPRSDLLAVLVFISWAASLAYLLNALISLRQFKASNQSFNFVLPSVPTASSTTRAIIGHQYSAGGVPKSIMRAKDASRKQKKKNQLKIGATPQGMRENVGVNSPGTSGFSDHYDYPPKECQEIGINLGEENGENGRNSFPTALPVRPAGNRDSYGSDLIIDHLAIQANQGKGSESSSSSEDSSRYASFDIEVDRAFGRPKRDPKEVLREAREKLRKIPFAPKEMNDESLDQSRESTNRVTDQSAKSAGTRFSVQPSAPNQVQRPPGFHDNLRSAGTESNATTLSKKDEELTEVLKKSYHRFDNADYSYVVTEEQLDNFANRQSFASDENEISDAINQIIRAVEEPKKN